MIDPKKNGNRTLRVRYDSGAVFVGPAIITDEGDTLVLLGGASSLLVRRADGSLPLHVANSGVSLPRRKRFCAGNGWDFKISVDFLKNCVKRITDPLAEL